MKALLLRLFGIGLVLGALAALAFFAGVQHQKAVAANADKKALAQAHQQYVDEVEKSQQAAAMYLEEHADQEDRYAVLEDKFNRLEKLGVPLLAQPAGQPQASPGPQASAPPMCINYVVRPQLSLGAVWMWNSALEGRDVPAGTCGAAEATPQACSAAAGLTVADAWRNHTVNAKQWAEDRLTCERLIDEIERRQQAQRDR